MCSYYLYAHQRRAVLCHAIRPSVQQSVNFLHQLCNSETVQDIFMKLSTSINHYQTMYREQECRLHLYFFCRIMPFEIFIMKIVSAR